MRVYSEWSGNPNGTPEDITRCVAEVYHRNSFGRRPQCHKLRGFGPNGEYCKIHAKKLANTKEIEE